MLKRKLEEIGSAVYRKLIFPFVRIGLEMRTGSVMKQGSYVNKGTVLCGKNYIGKNTMLSNTVLGYGSYVTDNGKLNDIVIGKYCSIAPGFKCIGGTHPTGTFVSTHPAFFSINNVSPLKYVKEQKFKENQYITADASYKIGNDVWIGTDVSIMQGVTIGDGCIIGANSLVTSDLEPYGIYAGTPARLIRKRFLDGQISRLSCIKWWDKGEAWIKDNIDKFSDISIFLEENKPESLT